MKNSINLLLVSILSSCIFTCNTLPKLPNRGVCAHRGANKTHPENTMAAFKEAIRLGAQMIEFDVRMTKDHELIIMHDKMVDRTTDGVGEITDLTLSELRNLDAGSWKDLKFTGEKIPLFIDVIDIMPRNVWLNIHIKGDSETAKRAAQIIVDKGRMHQAIFACKYEEADKIHHVNSTLILCNMERLNSTEEYVDSTIAKKYDFIQLLAVRADSNLSELVRKLKENNIMINYYVADTTDKFKSLLNDGIDFTLTNNLKEFIEVAKEFDVKPVKPIY